MMLLDCSENHKEYCRQHYLFLKVVDSRHVHVSKIQSLILLHWELRSEVQIIQQFKNHFVVFFRDCRDCFQVLSQGAWILQGLTLAVFSWEPHKPITKVSFPSIHVWVQVFGLSLDYYTEEVARAIGNKIGTFLDYDWSSSTRSGGFRIKVAVPGRITLSNLSKISIHPVEQLDLFFMFEGHCRVCG